MTTKSSNKIKIHYSIPDYYNYYKKKYNNSKIDKKKYNDIISFFNKKVIDLIVEDNLDYHLPHLNFVLTTRKEKRKPRIVNGKLHNNIPIDWKATKNLWEESEEAKDKKLLIRYTNYHTSGYVFTIKIVKVGFVYKNKRHYKFKAARDFARALGKRIKDDNKEKYDTYKLY